MRNAFDRFLPRLAEVLPGLPGRLAGFWLGPPQSHGSGRWARATELKQLGRRAAPGDLPEAAMVAGWFTGRLVVTPKEDNLVVFGVQRSGKTSTVIVPTLLGWKGPALATSTKEELVRLTGAWRRRLGRVRVFAPLERDFTWVEGLGLQVARWNPLRPGLGVSEAAELAHHFTAPDGARPPDHWQRAASSLLTALFALEASRGGDLTAVLGQLNRLKPEQYSILALQAEDQRVRDLLLAHAQTPEREAGSIASTARAALSLWIDPRVADRTSSGPGGLEVNELLDGCGTLFLVAPAEEAERCPSSRKCLVSLFVEFVRWLSCLARSRDRFELQ